MAEEKKISKRDLELYGLGLPEEEVADLLPTTRDPRMIEAKAKQQCLLNAYVHNGGMIMESCNEVGVKYYTHKSWLRRDPIYARAFEIAVQDTVEVLEEEVVRRGKHGYDEPVFYQGAEVGKIKKFSDNLLMFRLKKLDPSYKDKSDTNIGIAGKDIKIAFVEPTDT